MTAALWRGTRDAGGREGRRCEPIALPRLHVDPGVWDRADGGGFVARIVLGECALVLEARGPTGDGDGDAVQEAEIDGHRYLVAAYEA
ncbi:MAG: hypothetical protein ACYDH6_17595 [Acidimicrobiales bacterium]